MIVRARPGWGGEAQVQAGATPTLTWTEVEDVCGKGRAVVVTYPVRGGTIRAVHVLYEQGEFCASELVVAAGQQPIVLRTADVLAGELDLGEGEVRVLRNEQMWTTTTRVLDKPARSHFVSALYNRQTRLGAVLGALTAEAAALITTERTGQLVAFSLAASYEGQGGPLRVEAGQTKRTGPFAVVLPRQIFDGLEAYGAAVRQYNRLQMYRPIPCGWCSWDAFNWILDEKQLESTIDIIEKLRLPEYGFNVFQIDDGWQCGWRCSGDWQPNPRRFPRGLKPIADRLNKLGLKLGLWIGPFSDEDQNNSAGPSGELKAGAPSWMAAARPVLVNFPQFQVHRNGQPTGVYDISLPAFQHHLTDTLRRLTESYGARYIKADFLAWGYGIQADKTLPEHDIYRNALRAMRAGMAPGTYFMTCISHEWKSLGIADGQRIGNDVGHDWKGIRPTARCAAGWYFYNGNLWWNDPDQLHVSGSIDKDGRVRGLTLNQARAWATLVALYGGVTLTGDRLDGLDPERIKLLTQCFPPTGRTARPLDLFDVLTEQSPELYSRLWVLRVPKPFGDYHLVAVFNWTENDPQRCRVSLTDLGYAATERLLLYDYWGDLLLPEHTAETPLEVEVPPASVRLLVVHRRTGQPQFLASDRHIVTGEVDVKVVESVGDAVRGQSEALVSGVPFRYVFFAPEGWRAADAEFDGKPASVDAATNGLTRVTFIPSQPRINWSVKFQRTRTVP